MKEYMGFLVNESEKTKEIWKSFLKKIQQIRDRGEKVNKSKLKAVFSKAVKKALKLKHRRMFVFTGKSVDKSLDYISLLISEYVKLNPNNEIEGLFACSNLDNEPERSHFKSLQEKIKDLTETKPVKLDGVEFKQSYMIMGRTFDLAIIDLTVDLHPNDIGRLIETVAGGGVVFLLLPTLEDFSELKTRFYEYITTLPWNLDFVPGRFMKMFLKRLFESYGVYIFDSDYDKFLKVYKEPTKIPQKRRKKLEIPEKKILPDDVYRIARTQDQIEALKMLEKLSRRRDSREIAVIKADRGRGKSASLGMFLAALAKLNAGKGHLGRFLILVTAPEEHNVYTLFEFAEKTLEILGEDIKVYKSPPEIRGRGFVIAYYPPFDLAKVAKRDKPEFIAVDESAGIAVPLLFRFMELSNKVIYSSTIHGYEGAGRGFSIRFINVVKQRRDIIYREIELKEPIRYSEGDPIEEFLYRTLLLKATPPKLYNEDLVDIEKGNVYLERLDLDKCVFEDSRELEEFIGIYVFSHYRNQPKDLGILLDAPHYEAYALKTMTGKIVTAVLIAKEGLLPKSVIQAAFWDKKAEPSGHLVPMAVENHYRDTEFPQLAGVRVVRIATHPEVMRRGLGSTALMLIEKEFSERGFDWIGSGFGANPDLMRFWLKNRYVPIHISPKRNQVSGEYTVVVIKPLNKELEPLIREYYREFRIRFIDWLRFVHYDIEPELARLLLTGGYIWRKIENPFISKPKFTEIQKKRLKAYIKGVLSYELSSDTISELVRNYFVDESPNKPKLSRKGELILICRTLQARTANQTMDLLKIDKLELKKTFRESIEALYKYYMKEIEERSAKYSS